MELLDKDLLQKARLLMAGEFVANSKPLAAVAVELLDKVIDALPSLLSRLEQRRLYNQLLGTETASKLAFTATLMRNLVLGIWSIRIEDNRVFIHQ